MSNKNHTIKENRHKEDRIGVAMVKKNPKIYFFIALFSVSIILNFSFFYHKLTHKDLVLDQYKRYSFLSKRVFLEDPNDVVINFVPLRKALNEYVNAQNGKVGVYFEYLPSGISIGVNDREEVRLASLSKVPLAMSILRKVERGGLSLDKKVALKKENLNSKFGSLWKAGEGAEFTVKDLMGYMLKESDNTAYHTLLSLLTSEEVIEVYQNLEVEVSSKDTTPLVSPHSYSSIFRSLYLASFLSWDFSNYLLTVLSETGFSNKIPAGVESGVPVSHKIGVFSRADNEEQLFSDCGIVYVPKRPYILCIFVQESDNDAIKHMSLISKMVYGYVKVVN